jgi:hypothetical protein
MPRSSRPDPVPQVNCRRLILRFGCGKHEVAAPASPRGARDSPGQPAAPPPSACTTWLSFNSLSCTSGRAQGHFDVMMIIKCFSQGGHAVTSGPRSAPGRVAVFPLGATPRLDTTTSSLVATCRPDASSEHFKRRRQWHGSRLDCGRSGRRNFGVHEQTTERLVFLLAG